MRYGISIPNFGTWADPANHGRAGPRCRGRRMGRLLPVGPHPLHRHARAGAGSVGPAVRHRRADRADHPGADGHAAPAAAPVGRGAPGRLARPPLERAGAARRRDRGAGRPRVRRLRRGPRPEGTRREARRGAGHHHRPVERRGVQLHAAPTTAWSRCASRRDRSSSRGSRSSWRATCPIRARSAARRAGTGCIRSPPGRTTRAGRRSSPRSWSSCASATRSTRWTACRSRSSTAARRPARTTPPWPNGAAPRGGSRASTRGATAGTRASAGRRSARSASASAPVRRGRAR